VARHTGQTTASVSLLLNYALPPRGRGINIE
jgi:hypothetical protein